MTHKKFNACLLAIIFSYSILLLTSCNNSPLPNTQDDCLKGLTDSQKEVINKMITLLKDKSKITAESAIGFSSFIKKDGKDFTESSNTVSNYTEGYLTDFFKILDLTPFPLSDADRMYGKYVGQKCAAIETRYPTLSGRETKSVLVSIDSLHALVDNLWNYQTITQRKTGIRVVFAGCDDTNDAGVTRTGQLTYFMVGTIDTLQRPAAAFNGQYQKDLTILSSNWAIPAWGYVPYNHGELCPQQCNIAGAQNTRYNQ